MKMFVKLVVIGFLFLLLAGVRFFETSLFYDPLRHFYEGNYLTETAPDFDALKLILSTSLRYWLNSLLSLLILYVAFHSRKIMRFSWAFYGFIFVVLLLLFTYLVLNMHIENYFTLFYVRRFLIQPLFILLLLPAFYYQKSIKK